jgi:hypothetical protein
MSDPVFKIVLQGVDAGASSTVDKMVEKLNKAKETTRKWNDERAKLARDDRNSKFRQLSDEDKLTKLKDRQVQIEQRLERATQSGNQTRMTALKLAQARNKAAIGAASGGGDGLLSSVSSLRGGVIGGVFASIAGAARSALSFADNMSDLADQLGVTKKQVVEITRAAGYAGVSTRQIVGNLSSLEAARSAALGGDEKMKALFAKYGVDPSKGNVIDVAQNLRSSIGKGGLSTEDRQGFGSLVGRRPEAFIAMMQNITDAGDDIGSKLDRLDAANTRIEQFWNKVKEVNATVFAGILEIGDNYSKYSADPRTGAPSSMNGLDAVQRRLARGQGAPSGAIGPNSMADLRRLDDTRLGVGGAVQAATYRTPAPQADALARMGLYVGGGPNQANNVLRQQLNELKLIKDAARSSNQAIRSL